MQLPEVMCSILLSNPLGQYYQYVPLQIINISIAAKSGIMSHDVYKIENS